MAAAPDPDPQLTDPEPYASDPDPPDHSSVAGDAREATHLARLKRNYSRASSSRPGSSTLASRPTGVLQCMAYSVKKFWEHQISVVVPHEACRDHLALERTFLGYLRTSLAFSMLGVATAQLFRLQNTPGPGGGLGFFTLGTPLACTCQGVAIFTLFIGAFRTWRSQNAIVRGKAISGGFEIVLLLVGTFLVLLLFLIVVVAVDVKLGKAT